MSDDVPRAPRSGLYQPQCVSQAGDEFAPPRNKHAPITKATDLDALDSAEVSEGYRDGGAGEPEPGDNRSLSYWHGWRNGAMDRGHIPIDTAARALTHDVIVSGWLQREIGNKIRALHSEPPK